MIFNIKNKLIFHIIPIFIGIIISFSLPPYNYLLVNFIFFPIFFIFFVSNITNNKWDSFKIGWLFGFGYFFSNIYWITNSLTFDDQFKTLIPIAFLIIPLFLGLFYAIATFICSFFNLKNNLSSILIFALAISSIEFIRGFILGGFPWNLHVYSLVNHIYFLQSLSLIGTYTLNLIAITIFTIPSIFLLKNTLKSKLIITFTVILFIISNYIFGVTKVDEYNYKDNIEINSTIKLISPKIEIDRFFENEESPTILNDLIELSNPNPLENTIFVFPEGILTSVYLEDLIRYKKLFKNNFSSNHKIILGISSNKDSKIFNSLVVLDNNLNVLFQYNKNKLVPFGEFLPFENLFSKLGMKKIITGYQSFTADNNRKTFNLNNIKYLPLICYEIIYTGYLNKNSDDFDFIINISEDGWFGNSIGLQQHFSHSIFRAIEEGKNLIRSANNGTTAYINSVGQVVESIESTQKGVIEIKSFKKVENTFFSKNGNIIFFYFLSFYIILIFFLKKSGE